MKNNKLNDITLRIAIKELVDSYEIQYLTSHFIHQLYNVSELNDEQFKSAVLNVNTSIKSLMDLSNKETDCLIGLDVYIDDTNKTSLIYDVFFTLPNDT